MKRVIELSVVGLVLMGCTPQPSPVSKSEIKTDVAKEEPTAPPVHMQPEPVVETLIEGSHAGLAEQLEALASNPKMQQIEITTDKEHYAVGEAISFTIDTKGAVGYLYLIAVDKEKITFLQPNPFSVMSELQGKHRFPEDFTQGKFDVGAVKYCHGCERETTTLYALLSKKILNDLRSITGNQLLSFVKESTQAKVFSKGMMLRVNEEPEHKDFAIGKLEIVVK